MSQPVRSAFQVVLILLGVALLLGGIISGSTEREIGTEDSTGISISMDCGAPREDGSFYCDSGLSNIKHIDGYIKGSNATNLSMAGIGSILIAIWLGATSHRRPYASSQV